MGIVTIDSNGNQNVGTGADRLIYVNDSRDYWYDSARLDVEWNLIGTFWE